MRNKGYNNVVNVLGGINAWISSKYPTKANWIWHIRSYMIEIDGFFNIIVNWVDNSFIYWIIFVIFNPMYRISKRI